MQSKNDKFSLKKLCDSCDHKSCCTDFASPILLPGDLDRLKHLKNYEDFITEIVIDGRKAKTIKKKQNSPTCTFWDENTNMCTIYKNRPFDCRIFPFDLSIENNEIYWIAFSCNKNTDWSWAEPFLQKLEEDPQIEEILENVALFDDLEYIKKFEKSISNYVILRKVRRKKLLKINN